jgi:uncharacterized protein YjdB
MLDQRTAAIAYQVNATGDDSNADGSEIRVAVIDIERGRITSDLRLTNNDTADDNPQITVATVDGAKRFVVAWHATSATGGSDIRLETINPDGTVYPQFVTSLALADDQAAVGQYFRFVRGEALDVASLALVTARNPKVTAGAVEAGAVDVIRFAEHAGQVYPSSPVELFSYNQGQVAESIDAYSFQGTGRICVHALATTYVVGAEPAGGYSYRCGQAVNAIVVDEIAVPTSEVMQGVTLQLPIAVHNRGVNIIEKIEVAGFGPDPFEVDGLVVPPGRTQTVYLPYTVPTVVVDVDWQVKATFAAAGPSGPNAAPVTGTLRLAVPDLGLSQATVVDAGQTTRTIQLAAFNASAAEVPDGATVNVGLYSDADFTEATKLASTTLSDADIALLAGGQTTKQLTWSFRPGAIPAGGTRLFAKIEAIDSQGQVVAEYVTDNNTASIPIMDLSGVGASGRFGAVVRLDNSDPSHSEADLAITNYHSAPAAPGTATVTLLDADQNVIEQRQLDLTAEIAVEQTTTERIVFTKVGVDILVEFWENPSSPVIDAQPPANLVVNQCSPIELTVGAHLAPGASGVLTVDWFNGGNPVSGQHATTLRIAEAGPDDAGRYSAVLTNRIGSNATAITTSTTQVVVVPGPPGNICQSVPGDGDPGAKEPDSVGPGGTTGIPPAQPIDPGTSRSTGAEPISVAISRVSTQLPGPTRIWVGQSLQYHATVRPASADQTVVWSSSKPTVAAVDATGSVKGLGEGKTVLRAVAANGAAATKTINVVKRVTKVAGPVSKATLVKGTSMKIPVVAYSQVGGKAKLTWKSSRPKVAKVSLNGKVTALSPGRTTITATALSGKQMRMVVKVVAKAKVASRVSATLAGEGANIWVKTELTPNGATVAKAPIFRSSNPKVATVDAAGRIEGKKAGKATITVRYAGKVVKRNIAIGQ